MLLLPNPNEGDVEGFKELYQKKSGVELDDTEARNMLTGLMVFIYLTEVRRPDDPK